MVTRRRARDASAVAAGVGVALLALLVANHLTDAFDAGITAWLTAPAQARAFQILRPVTELGSTWAVTIVAVALLVLLGVRGTPRLGLIAAGMIGLTSLVNTGFKQLLARARPEVVDAPLVEAGFSFPSGHALLSATAYGVVAVLVIRSRLRTRVRAVLVALLATVVLLVGFSRLHLGVHYVTDVVAGWLAGVLIALLFARFTEPRTDGGPVDVGDARPATVPRAPHDAPVEGGRA